MSKIKFRMTRVVFWGIAFSVSTFCHAQQQPLFTQYMFNGLVLNPAYTGSHEFVTLTASARSQWSGLKGAPQTQVFSAHSPIKLTRSAAGMLFQHDKAGAIEQSTVYGTYAYHIPVSKTGKISVGAQVGATFYKANYADLNIVTQNNLPDPAFAGSTSRVLPNLGIGAYYYTQKMYVGISIPTIIDNRWNVENSLEKSKQQRHYLMTAGYVFTLNSALNLKPNVLIKWAEGGPFQYDLNANLLIKETVWVGFSYRMGDSVDGLLQWNVNDQLSVGYSYGYPTSDIASAQWGTHEVVLIYRLKRDKHIIQSPRYF